MYKIGILIPSTSKHRNWTTIQETYLTKYTIKTFLMTYNEEHTYIFYIGIDENDYILDNSDNQNKIMKIIDQYSNIEIKFIQMTNIQKGHLTKMWNILFQKAYHENCDYFFQCGDDISFETKNWINDSILTLKKHNNIGLTGPINNNFRILTQAFVSRKHMEIFGSFFPEIIINWCCDDWYNLVYKPNYFFPLNKHYCINKGGKPRYEINNNSNFKYEINKNITQLRNKVAILAEKDKIILHNFISINKNKKKNNKFNYLFLKQLN
tara:strand:- start:1417 stop:2214 length:798 start_codon:yes stop_codon:yes gene_type:complete